MTTPNETPICKYCGSASHMVNHDGKWICHNTHPVDKPNETPTPRTDAVAFEPNAEINPICVEADFARQLEHELAEAKAKSPVSAADANELQDILHTLTNSGTALKTSARELVVLYDKHRSERDELRAKLHEAEAACAEMRETLEKLSNQFKYGWASGDMNGGEVISIVMKIAKKALQNTTGEGWHSPGRICLIETQINELVALVIPASHNEGAIQQSASWKCEQIRSAIYQLRDENAKLIIENQGGALMEGALQKRIAAKDARIAELERQLAEARKDSERLQADLTEVLDGLGALSNPSELCGWSIPEKRAKAIVDNAKGEK